MELFLEIGLLTDHLLSAVHDPKSLDAATRIVQLLWALGHPSRTPGEIFTTEVSQAQAASMLGVSVRTVARNLRRLEATGVIRTARGRIGLLEDRRNENSGRTARRNTPVWQFRGGNRARRGDAPGALGPSTSSTRGSAT